MTTPRLRRGHDPAPDDDPDWWPVDEPDDYDEPDPEESE